MLRKGVFAVMMTAFAVLGPRAATSQVLFDNLGGFVVAGDGIAALGPLGDSFSTGGNRMILSSIEIHLAIDRAPDEPNVDDVVVSLLTDNATSPGSLIAEIGRLPGFASDAPLNEVFSFAPTAPISLAANSRFWVMVSTSSSHARWLFSSDLGSTGVDGEFFFSIGKVWSDSDGPYMMRVVAEPAPVPIPSPTLFLASGLSAAGLMMGRKKRIARGSAA